MAYLTGLGIADDPTHVLPGVSGDGHDVDLPHAGSAGPGDLGCEVKSPLFGDGLRSLVGDRRSVQGCGHATIVADLGVARQGWPR